MPLLVFMVGALSVAGAYFKVADLLQYVSRSVLVGYITGAAILIMTNQMKHLLGIAEPMSEAGAKTFFSIVQAIGSFWESYQWQPLLLGGGTLAIYLYMQKRLATLPNFAICLTISTLATYLLKMYAPAFSEIATFTPFREFSFSPSLPVFDFDTISALFEESPKSE